MKISRIERRLAREKVASAGRVHWFDTIGSTNDFVLHREDYHATVCIAGEQTAGRGRRGRHWQSAPGQGIYLSMGWDLGGAPAGGLSLLCGLVVRSVLADAGVQEVGLKWPNDVLLGSHKLAGILVEMSAGRCVIGIGVNVKLPARSASGTAVAAMPATGLVEHGYDIDLESLAANLIVYLNRDLETFMDEGFGPRTAEWDRAHLYHGADVVILGERSVRGRVMGVADDGALSLDTAEGRRVVHGGEVSLRPSAESR